MRRHTWRAPCLGLLLLTAITACDDDDDLAGPGDEVRPTLLLVAEGFTSPVAAVEPPDGSGRLFVVDQAGTIRIVTEEGELLDEPFLDVSGLMVGLESDFDERGLLGLAFHPDFEENGRFYVYYSAPLRAVGPAGWDHTSHISEFTVSADPDVADLASERILLEVDEPQANHNGGTVTFGPDGLLYVSLGDGGGANDTGLGHVAGGNGQQPLNLLGKILRIDVDNGTPYGIPAANPFVGESQGRGEVFAWGFRNPYRFSFDRETGDLIVGDAGQDLWEEVNLVDVGGNYGWNVREGTHCFDPDNPGESLPACTDTGVLGEPLLGPVIEYANANQEGGVGLAVVGGYVYRGSLHEELEGLYVFGDFSSTFEAPAGTIFVATPSSSGLWSMEEMDFPDRAGGRLGHFLKGFGEDLDGEIYVLTSDEVGPVGSTGRVYALVPGDFEGTLRDR